MQNMAGDSLLHDMETFIVKFWITNKDGFREQLSEEVDCETKHDHHKAQFFIQKKYKKHNVEVVSVKYV